MEEDDGEEDSEKPVVRTKVGKQTKQVTKVNFASLQQKQVQGDDVYEHQKEKLREKKVERKLQAAVAKKQVAGEVQAMGDKIQRNINHDIEKAKGIVRKRKREDKNPRVKRRR